MLILTKPTIIYYMVVYMDNGLILLFSLEFLEGLLQKPQNYPPGYVFLKGAFAHPKFF